MARKNMTDYRGDLKQVFEEAASGITLERAEQIARPHVSAREAVKKDRRAKTRTLLRSMGCIPHIEPSGFVYVRAENMTPSHARDAIERRQKHCSGLIKNSVGIAISTTRQQSLFYAPELSADRMLLLEGTLETLESACEQIRAEIRKEKGIRRKRRRSV